MYGLTETYGPSLLCAWQHDWDEMDLDTSTVTGNREQPKVMYIVPWQQPGATETTYTPAASLAEDLYRQIDRDEFVRELEYRGMLATPDADSASDD